MKSKIHFILIFFFAAVFKYVYKNDWWSNNILALQEIGKNISHWVRLKFLNNTSTESFEWDTWIIFLLRIKIYIQLFIIFFYTYFLIGRNRPNFFYLIHIKNYYLNHE